MTSSSVSVNSSKANIMLYHPNVNGSIQDHSFAQSVSQKTFKMRNHDRDFHTPPSSFTNSSPSQSPIINRNNINNISNSPNPFRRASAGNPNRGSMRKMLPALPDMDTQVNVQRDYYGFHLIMFYILKNYFFWLIWLFFLFLDVLVSKDDWSENMHAPRKSFLRPFLFRVFVTSWIQLIKKTKASWSVCYTLYAFSSM